MWRPVARTVSVVPLPKSTSPSSGPSPSSVARKTASVPPTSSKRPCGPSRSTIETSSELGARAATSVTAPAGSTWPRNWSA